jgi:hypothetical protein
MWPPSLRGEKPADLPVQAQNSSWWINLKTTNTLGPDVPRTLPAATRMDCVPIFRNA